MLAQMLKISAAGPKEQGAASNDGWATALAAAAGCGCTRAAHPASLGQTTATEPAGGRGLPGEVSEHFCLLCRSPERPGNA